MQFVIAVVNRCVSVEFQVGNAEIQCQEHCSISTVSINDILTLDLWNSCYEPHFVVKFIYLLVASDLKIIKPAHLKVVCCCCFILIENSSM